MREILFRGKRIDNGEWVEGYLYIKYFQELPHDRFVIEYKPNYILKKWQPEYMVTEIDPETVGQYTVLTDKNGKRIFEGDIVKNDWCFACGYSVIKFGQYKPLDMSNEYQQGHLGFYLEHIHEADKRSVRKDILYFANNCEVIGNIHDNPELLENEVDTE